MLFSVIVPVYKVEKYLPQCIESILAQTYEDFELILVDDGSPDNCPTICDEYKKRDKRIKVVHKGNGGSVSARKAGLHLAKGEYICFVDGDDFVSEDMLSTYEKVLIDGKTDIICTGYSEYHNEDKIIAVPQKIVQGFYDKNKLQSEIHPQMLSTQPFYNFYVNPTVWTKCFRKSLCEDANANIPDNISLGDDVAVVFGALLKANSIRVIDYQGYMYRQTPNSMTRTYDRNLYEKMRNVILYLKSLERETHWQVGTQINEYAVFLLILAKYNEFVYNVKDTYFNKIKNMKRYLNDGLFKEALRNIKVSGLRNKFIICCFKLQFLMPFEIYEKRCKR